jgi:hypothetical protein
MRRDTNMTPEQYSKVVENLRKADLLTASAIGMLRSADMQDTNTFNGLVKVQKDLEELLAAIQPPVFP